MTHVIVTILHLGHGLEWILDLNLFAATVSYIHAVNALQLNLYSLFDGHNFVLFRLPVLLMRLENRLIKHVKARHIEAKID